jgi:hypothetical protein
MDQSLELQDVIDKFKEIIYDYGAKYGSKKGLSKVVLLGSQLFSVYEWNKRELINGEWSEVSVFDEVEELDSFCNEFILGAQKKDFSIFTNTYFKQNNRFKYSLSDKINIMTWSVVGKNLGDKYYERPGVIVSFHVNYFSPFLFYSLPTDQEQHSLEESFINKLSPDLEPLNECIRVLDEFLGIEEE